MGEEKGQEDIPRQAKHILMWGLSVGVFLWFTRGRSSVGGRARQGRGVLCTPCVHSCSTRRPPVPCKFSYFPWRRGEAPVVSFPGRVPRGAGVLSKASVRPGGGAVLESRAPVPSAASARPARRRRSRSADGLGLPPVSALGAVAPRAKLCPRGDCAG